MLSLYDIPEFPTDSDINSAAHQLPADFAKD